MKPTMNNQEFTKVINCLPDGFTWGSALTPAIALHIINAARAAQKNEELFAIYKLCNQLVAYIGAFGEIKQSNSIVNQMMDALYTHRGAPHQPPAQGRRDRENR